MGMANVYTQDGQQCDHSFLDIKEPYICYSVLTNHLSWGYTTGDKGYYFPLELCHYWLIQERRETRTCPLWACLGGRLRNLSVGFPNMYNIRLDRPYQPVALQLHWSHQQELYPICYIKSHDIPTKKLVVKATKSKAWQILCVSFSCNHTSTHWCISTSLDYLQAPFPAFYLHLSPPPSVVLEAVDLINIYKYKFNCIQ